MTRRHCCGRDADHPFWLHFTHWPLTREKQICKASDQPKQYMKFTELAEFYKYQNIPQLILPRFKIAPTTPAPNAMPSASGGFLAFATTKSGRILWNMNPFHLLSVSLQLSSFLSRRDSTVNNIQKWCNTIQHGTNRFKSHHTASTMRIP